MIRLRLAPYDNRDSLPFVNRFLEVSRLYSIAAFSHNRSLDLSLSGGLVAGRGDRNRPSQSALASALRSHPCVALSSGRVL